LFLISSTAMQRSHRMQRLIDGDGTEDHRGRGRWCGAGNLGVPTPASFASVSSSQSRNVLGAQERGDRTLRVEKGLPGRRTFSEFVCTFMFGRQAGTCGAENALPDPRREATDSEGLLWRSQWWGWRSVHARGIEDGVPAAPEPFCVDSASIIPARHGRIPHAASAGEFAGEKRSAGTFVLLTCRPSGRKCSVRFARRGTISRPQIEVWLIAAERSSTSLGPRELRFRLCPPCVQHENLDIFANPCGREHTCAGFVAIKFHGVRAMSNIRWCRQQTTRLRSRSWRARPSFEVQFNFDH